MLARTLANVGRTTVIRRLSTQASYQEIKDSILKAPRELTRDEIRAARRRTGPPKPRLEDKKLPEIPVVPVAKDNQTLQALSIIKQQKDIYAIVEIKEMPFYVTVGDVIVANRMNDLKLGDVIKLDRVTEFGGEDYVLKGNPFVHPSFFDLEAVVIEHAYSKDNVTIRKNKKTTTERTHRNAHTLLRVRKIEILDS